MQSKVEFSFPPPENLSDRSGSMEGEGGRALQEATGLSIACSSAAQAGSLLSPSKASAGKKTEFLRVFSGFPESIGRKDDSVLERKFQFYPEEME